MANYRGFCLLSRRKKKQREVWKPGSNDFEKTGDGLKLIGVWVERREDAVWRQWSGELGKCFSTLELPKVSRTRCYPRPVRTFSGETQTPAFPKTFWWLSSVARIGKHRAKKDRFALGKHCCSLMGKIGCTCPDLSPQEKNQDSTVSLLGWDIDENRWLWAISPPLHSKT